MTIKDQAEDIIEGIKEKFECDEHENCDGIHLDDRIAEKAKEIINNFNEELRYFKHVCPFEMLDKLDNPISLKLLTKKVS